MNEQVEIRTSKEVVATLIARPRKRLPSDGADLTETNQRESNQRRKKSIAPDAQQWVRWVRVENNADVECDLDQIAKDWRYILGNRSRWTSQAVARAQVQQKCESTLLKLGIDRGTLKRLADASLVEVSIPHCHCGTFAAARDFPWEHLIAGATKAFRGPSPILIVRHLLGAQKSKKRNVKSFAIAQTAPAIFEDHFHLASERSLISGALQSLKDIGRLDNPVTGYLKSQIESAAPDLIHLAGMDIRLGEWLEAEWLEDEVRFQENTREGMYFAHTRKPYMKVFAKHIAKCLTSAKRKPTLIGINSWYSGTELAPLCVANGVATAIGFHNSFDDEVGREFYAEFYRAWLEHDLDIVRAMLCAWIKIRPLRKKIRGSGISVWSSTSVFDGRNPSSVKPSVGGFRAAIQAEKELEDAAVSIEADPELDCGRDLVGIQVKPLECLNYSMLHNRRSLLDKLMFWFKTPLADEDGRRVNEIRNVEVEILLKVGDGSFPYRTTVNLGDRNLQIDLADDSVEVRGENQAGGICVPLTSELARSVDERMNTSIYVNVQWKGEILYRHTHPVFLAPVDEWNLSEAESCWLPSFVQPRDPAVTKIISSAQKYLRCLLDDPSASFSGYQNEGGDVDYVMAQVKSIWSTIVYDYQLGYIGPPPAYSENTQRLRTPGQVLREQRGTCIDLTTLFVSCLEWIELYPVIFMTGPHAFAGFWRRAEYHTEYIAVASQQAIDGTEGIEQVTGGGKFPWVADKSAYCELKKFVDDEKLIPIECVDLTEYSGFQKTWDFACRYFDPEDEWECFDPKKDYDNRIGKFHSLIDIVSSRKRVTPLPLLDPGALH